MASSPANEAPPGDEAPPASDIMDEGQAPLTNGDAPKKTSGILFGCGYCCYCCGLTCGLTILLAPSVLLLGWVVPQNWKYEESSRLHYLNTWGIGAAVWGTVWTLFAIALIFGLVTGVVHKPPPPFKDHDLILPNVPSSRGLDPSDFQDVFEWTWMRLVKVLALFGQVTLNITFIGYNAYSLPTRDPDEPLNQAKHAVSWFETGLIGFYILMLCVFLSKAVCNASAQAFGVRKSMQFLSIFSVLKAISLANPMKMMQRLRKNYRVQGFGGALASAVGLFFFVPSAIASVLVKLAQVDFVTRDLYWTWTWWNFLQLAGFINNLASLGPDMTTVRLAAVWQFLELDSRGADPWLEALCRKLVRHYGFSRGMMYVLTISEVDIYKLLNMNNRKPQARLRHRSQVAPHPGHETPPCIQPNEDGTTSAMNTQSHT